MFLLGMSPFQMDEGFTHLYEPEYLKLLRASKSSASLGPLDPYLLRSNGNTSVKKNEKINQETVNKLVRQRLDFLFFNLVQEGRENSPGFGQLIRSNEMHLRSTKDVENQPFVSVRHFDVLDEKKFNITQSLHSYIIRNTL